MSEQDRLDLKQNKIRYQEVLDALALRPDNEALIELKCQLEEVIELSSAIIGDDENQDEWKVHEECMAMCSSDKLYYKAEIIEMLPKDKVAVRFLEYDKMDVCSIDCLKKITMKATNRGNNKRKVGADSNEERLRRIEKKKVKRQKLEEKNELVEKQCEKEKNQWLHFNKKMSKQLKAKKSIFASPETVEGKVGIGTCGTGGRPMTKFTTNPSYIKSGTKLI